MCHQRALGWGTGDVDSNAADPGAILYPAQYFACNRCSEMSIKWKWQNPHHVPLNVILDDSKKRKSNYVKYGKLGERKRVNIS